MKNRVFAKKNIYFWQGGGGGQKKVVKNKFPSKKFWVVKNEVWGKKSLSCKKPLIMHSRFMFFFHEKKKLNQMNNFQIFEKVFYPVFAFSVLEAYLYENFKNLFTHN